MLSTHTLIYNLELANILIIDISEKIIPHTLCAEYILTFNFVKSSLISNDGATETRGNILSHFPYEPVTSALSL